MKSTPSASHHKPIKELVFDALHRRIIAGEYSPGEWLRQEDIASWLEVSMTPVREALDLLVSAGLAERVPFRGVRVLQLSRREIVEAYGMRLLLEGLAAREAALRISPDQIRELTQIQDALQEQIALSDMSRARQLSREFHTAVVQSSDDALLIKLHEIASNAFPDWMLYEAMFRFPELLETSLTAEHLEHRAIVDALACGSPDDVCRRAVDHILHLGRDMEKLLGIPGEELRTKEQAVLPLLEHRM
jgi:DNA-binding GntR family transcriptional regulator